VSPQALADFKAGGNTWRGSKARSRRIIMKEGIHPKNYRDVVFKDVGADEAWITRSTVKTDRTITWEDGKEYPLFTLEISSRSHPFYTGKQKFIDTEGRVERFQKKYARTLKKD